MDLKREIPGYYYDAEKKKYFKVEKNAPQTVAWSAESVKRRKVEDREAQISRKLAAHRKRLVQKSRVLQDPLLGGFLMREDGNIPRDLRVDCWAKGLCYKGFVPMPPLYHGSVEYLYIHPVDEETGVGVAYASVGSVNLCGSYIPRDDHDRIAWDDITQPINRRRYFTFDNIPQTSSLKYHQSTHKILVSSRHTGEHGGVYCMSLDLSAYLHNDPPTWRIRLPRNQYNRSNSKTETVTNTCAAAPVSSGSLVGVAGTSRGLCALRSNGRVDWLQNGEGLDSPKDDVLSADFMPRHPDIVLAGVRSSFKILIADLRTPSAEWESVRHLSSPAQVRCLNEHQVLAAGPRSAMSIYDLRFRHREPSRNKPIVVFPAFKNEEAVHFGLDVDTTLGIVATTSGHERLQPASPTVKLFSLETGRRLKLPAALDALGPVLEARCLMFQTLPQETNPSLFIGGKLSKVHKFSFGGGHDEWTGEEFPALSDNTIKRF